MVLQGQKVRYKNKTYAVIPVKYKSNKWPVVIDYEDFERIRFINKNWKINSEGFVCCTHTLDGVTKEVPLHEIIMTLKMKSEGKKKQNRSILHINRIGLDNRRENLIYDTPYKDVNKNLKKKTRTANLPEESGVSLDEIPTYVWYMKPNGTHGERFMVEIGDVTWKTTASKKLSLRYKLEEAKMFLRQLKEDRPEIFEDFSMNGDYNKEGAELRKTFYSIINRGGHTNLQYTELKSKTDKLLKPNITNETEKKLLEEQGNLIEQIGSGQKRRILSNLPPDSGISKSEIPQYVYYRPEKNGRGDYFVIEGHPLLNDKVFQSSSSKNYSTREKFEQVLEYLEEIEDSSDSDED